MRFYFCIYPNISRRFSGGSAGERLEFLSFDDGDLVSAGADHPEISTHIHEAGEDEGLAHEVMDIEDDDGW